MTVSVPFFLQMRAALRAALGAVLVLAACSVPAHADDPFDMEPSSWISFDRYKEKPANWIPPEVRAQAALEPVVVSPPTLPPDMPNITEPTRAIVAPVMPGINKDFDVQVNTTADDNVLPVTFEGKKPEMSGPKSSWRDAVQFARNKKQATEKDEDADGGPLDVRFTFLPAMMAPPAVKPKIASIVRKPEIAQTTPPLPVTVAKPPATDPAACAAIDAYKKRQLAAIESDRQTLEALQAAISELGLQKKLDFKTGAGGSLKLQDAGQAKLDLPVAKN